MDCQEVQQRIIEGQVAPGLLRHLAACRDCAAFIRFHDRLLSPGTAPQAEPGAEVDVAVLLAACERLGAAPLRRPSGKGALSLPFPGFFRRRNVRLAAAAFLAVGLMLAGLVAYRARQAGASGAAAGSGVTVAPLAWNYDPFEPGLLSAGLQELEQHLENATTSRRLPSVEDELDKCAIELLLQEEEGLPETSPAAQPAAAVMGSILIV